MYKKLFNLMVLMITVLVVNLLTDYITTWLINYKVDLNPFKYTAIVMLMLVFVLVPAYSYLADKIELIAVRLLVKGSNSFGKIIGLLFSFALIFSILYAIYLYQLFHINLLQHIAKIVSNAK
jgi:hypothetical protein